MKQELYLHVHFVYIVLQLYIYNSIPQYFNTCLCGVFLSNWLNCVKWSYLSDIYRSFNDQSIIQSIQKHIRRKKIYLSMKRIHRMQLIYTLNILYLYVLFISAIKWPPYNSPPFILFPWESDQYVIRQTNGQFNFGTIIIVGSWRHCSTNH